MRSSSLPVTVAIRVFCCLSCLQLGHMLTPMAQAYTLSVPAIADTTIREATPGLSFGLGGSGSVSGPDAVNASGVARGAFATFMRFWTSSVSQDFTDYFGTSQWQITGITVEFTEVSAPGNSIFNVGSGRTSMLWLQNDTWLEGSGTPNFPGTDGVNWDTHNSYLTPGTTTLVGTINSTGSNGIVNSDLTLASDMLARIESREDISFYLEAATRSSVFNFRSRNFNTPTAFPQMFISAVEVPEPTSCLWIGGALVTLRRRRINQSGAITL